MDANSLLAIALVGVLTLYLAFIVALVMVVKALASGQVDTEISRPSRKVFKLPGAASSTPTLVGAPKIVTPVESAAGPDGITRIDNTKQDDYKPLHEVPRGELIKAVDDYIKKGGDGRAAVGAVIDETEGEQ